MLLGAIALLLLWRLPVALEKANVQLQRWQFFVFVCRCIVLSSCSFELRHWLHITLIFTQVPNFLPNIEIKLQVILSSGGIFILYLLLIGIFFYVF